jgi:2-polyprenyl-6-methoxyphenol hydroxylase-like FAD-dependent oxidoreductase
MMPDAHTTVSSQAGDIAQIRDVIVIGGGPAGSTAAALLARNGWKVTLFERETHPRFHIGESLLPMNLPIFENLGVLDKVAAAGVRKNAAVFTSPTIKAKPTRFPFANALGESPPHAYQIQRSKLKHWSSMKF